MFAKGYGLSDVEKSIRPPSRRSTSSPSVTKPFTATAIPLLVEDGKLSLDGKITEILPGLPAASSPVTVRHLLSHTSGIKSYTDVFGQQKTPDSHVFTHVEILALVKDAPLTFTPGERYAYCNTGYYLLGMIVEKAVRQALRDVPRRSDQPLGMTSTSLDDYADARLRAGQGLQHDERRDQAGRAHLSDEAALGGRARVERRRPGQVGRRAARKC